MWIIILLIGTASFQGISCQCTFPTELTGTWVSSNDGTWEINSTHLLNFYTLSSTTGNTISTGVSQLNFECYENQGDTKYAIKSELFQLLGGQRSVYTCIDITEISENKLLYYHATVADPSGFQFTIQSVYENICNWASYIQPYNYHIALKSGTETTALQNCPSSLFGSYNYDTCIDVNSNDTSLDVCDTRQQFIYNYTLCNTTQMFSLEGVLDCVHHEESGSISYLTLYNRDSTAPDNNNYFQFVCLAVELSDGIVYVTANPNKCNDNQSTTAIDSPGETLQLTSYSFTSDESTNILPIIIGVIVALVLLALIALLIYCCYKRKCRRKKTDEEEALSESESEDEQQKKSESRRSSKSSLEEEEEKKSIDSGIGEPPVTGRTDSNNELDDDTKEQEHELVITAEGDKEIDDKNSRPCSGQRSRMSDLPPSTIPPDEDQPLSQRSEEDHIADENKEDEPDKIEEPEEPVDDQASEKADESDHEPEQKVDIDEDVKDENVKGETAESEKETAEDIEEEQQDLESEKEDQESENEDHEQMVNNQEDDIHEEGNQEDDRIDENEEEEEEDEILSQKGPDIQEDNEEPEQKEEEDDDEEDDDEEEEDEEGGHQQSDLEVTVDNKDEPAQENPDDEDTKSEDQEQKQEKEDTESQKESDAETKQHKHISSDEDDAEVQRRLIGLKKGKDNTTKGGLTTVLVSREEEERKRQKINSKSKKQKMKKLAKKKTKRFGGKGIKGDKRQLDSDDEIGSSDDEIRRRGLREAPFMKQYENKKHIEHILDEQHYWSDPEADKDSFRINDEMSSVFNSDFSSESEEEIIGADGIPVRVKKTKHDKRKKRGDGDDISNADSEYLRQKMLKRAGSVDSMVSVEDPDNIDQRKSKRRLNEHIMKMDIDEDITKEKGKSKTGGASGNEEEAEEDKSDRERTGDDKGKADTVANSKFHLNKAKTILVKEHSDMTDDSLNEKGRKSKKKSKRTLYGKENEEDLSDFCDTDIDKLSDRDSGMDEEEGDIDVLLTHDQQQMIVNMLFDEDMNLRPQFSRDENGRIVRRLDNTVVYDPHTGRFTYRKRLGQIFKVPRLKRNDKGRPLGGYIEDEFGPKPDQKPLRRKTSSARRSHSGKSGRLSVGTRLPSSADLKRVRTDGRNVGFSVPDEDIDTIPDADLEYNKRGRRDIGSAIRRQLNKRLFRKKRKLGSRGSPGTLPEVKVRKAWGDDDHLAPGTLSAGGPGGVSPLNPRSGRFVQGSPWAQRKTPTAGDAEQWQMYRDGLQSDRRILENLQDKLNAGERPFAPKEAFVESGGEINEVHEGHGDELHSRYDRGHSYFTDDGRICIRERGCPELKQQKIPLFTIIRRPGDLESFENLHGASTTERDVKSPPLQVQDYNAEQADNEQQEGNRYPSDNSLVARSNDGRCSEMTSIDDNRLRRLLEELYKDKKYFDNYVESKDPKSQEFLHSQGLAEHGRGYLLKRADYWERRGPLPPRPPMTAVGWKMQRQQTIAASRQASELGYSTMTCTPELSTTNMPGVVESPRGNEHISERNESRNSKNESFV
ncbi:uncharacterized protein LOC123558387 [Mercenaria mercenaria]|uniref:uncharacterized protein LOC123558387 n=1 Tax=Mercenaria mercenaria TaxID=6596 RepID=UPI00234F1828|nr:uncharacterized protein LOC123558387 [Mercenaria mercenaria]